MGFQNHPYIYILLFSTFCCIIAAGVVWERRRRPGARAFFVSMIGYILWTSTYAAYWSVPSPDAQVFWLSMTFFGVGVTTGASVWFGLDWTGRIRWLTVPRAVLLVICCAAPGILALTNPWHHLFYSSIVQITTDGPFYLEWQPGLGFMLFGMIIPNIINIGVIVLLFHAWWRARGLQRQQASIFLFAMLLPYAAILVAKIMMQADPLLHTPPFVSCIYALVMLHGLYLLKLFNVIPVARDALIENLDICMLIFNSENQVVDANLSARNLLGLSPDQVDGISLEEALRGFPQVIAFYAQMDPKNWAGKGALQEEIAVEDGFNTILSVRISPLQDHSGHVFGRIMTIQDITAQKQTDNALRESEQRYRLLAHNFTDVVWTVDMEGKFTYFSPSVYYLRGYTPDEVMNQSLEEAICPGSFPVILDVMEAARIEIQTGVKMPEKLIEVEQLCKNGTTVWTEASVRVMYDDQRHPIGIMGVTRNITERMKTQEALRIAKEAAEAASQAKTAFLANMSHELRTPLNAILGFSDILEHSPHLRPEERENIAIINRSGEHLLNLINEILDISKIEAGQMVVSDSRFDLHDMLVGLEEMFRLRAGEKNIKLRINVDPSTPKELYGDQGKLRQILINLLGNAIKFTNQGSVVLWVRAVLEDQFAHFQFDISDTGQGIPPEEQDRIFLPFMQAVDRRRGAEGTGLGLTISREFAHLMGGDLVVSSEVDLGSCFTLTVPFRYSGKIPENKRYSYGRRVRGLHPGQTERRILIAEDVLENRVLLLRVLEPLGLSIRTVENGEQAIEEWKAWSPHLIFMDIRMPVLDGLEAVQQIKSTPNGRGTNVIAITASVFEENRSAIEEAGFDDLIRKPYKEEDIYGVLENRLGLKIDYEEEEWWYIPGSLSDKTSPSHTVVSEKILHSLRQAALQADFNEVLLLVDQIAQNDPSFAEMIKKSIDAFDYRNIVDSIDQFGGRND